MRGRCLQSRLPAFSEAELCAQLSNTNMDGRVSFCSPALPHPAIHHMPLAGKPFSHLHLEETTIVFKFRDNGDPFLTKMIICSTKTRKNLHQMTQNIRITKHINDLQKKGADFKV